MNEHVAGVVGMAIFILMVCIFVVALIFWRRADNKRTKENEIKATQRFTYKGHVVAVAGFNVYLNSNHQKIELTTRDVKFVMGKEYEIVVDGNGKLIDVAIVGD
jgi:hypothetical protein